MRTMITPILAALLLSSSSPVFAGALPLFTVTKPENPENLIQVIVNVDASCKVQDLDYFWLMGGTQYKPMACTLKNAARTQFSQVSKNPAHKASCAATPLPAGATCDDKFFSSADLDVVNHGLSISSLVVRAIKGVSGSCTAYAFISADRPVQITKIITKGAKLGQGLSGGMAYATVRVDSVQVVGAGGYTPDPWTCNKGAGCTLTASGKVCGVL